MIKDKTIPTSLEFSPNGNLMAIMGKDRTVRVFNVATGKLYRAYNESLTIWNQLQKVLLILFVCLLLFQDEADNPYKLEPIDFGRRMAVERELEVKEAPPSNVVFDDSNNFIMYPTMIGIKGIALKVITLTFIVICLTSSKVVRVLGKVESSTRFLNIALYQVIHVFEGF